jgi:hypothetical protein
LGAKETIWIENKQYKNKVKHNKGTNKFGRHNPLEKAKQCMFLEGQTSGPLTTPFVYYILNRNETSHELTYETALF